MFLFLKPFWRSESGAVEIITDLRDGFLVLFFFLSPPPTGHFQGKVKVHAGAAAIQARLRLGFFFFFRFQQDVCR